MRQAVLLLGILAFAHSSFAGSGKPYMKCYEKRQIGPNGAMLIEGGAEVAKETRLKALNEGCLESTFHSGGDFVYGFCPAEADEDRRPENPEPIVELN
jgi:hypothetical protein